MLASQIEYYFPIEDVIAEERIMRKIRHASDFSLHIATIVITRTNFAFGNRNYRRRLLITLRIRRHFATASSLIESPSSLLDRLAASSSFRSYCISRSRRYASRSPTLGTIARRNGARVRGDARRVARRKEKERQAGKRWRRQRRLERNGGGRTGVFHE